GPAPRGDRRLLGRADTRRDRPQKEREDGADDDALAGHVREELPHAGLLSDPYWKVTVKPARHAGDRPMIGMPHELGAANAPHALHVSNSRTRSAYGAR